MINEERIIELLAEMVQQNDQMSKGQDQLIALQSLTAKTLERVIVKLDELPIKIGREITRFDAILLEKEDDIREIWKAIDKKQDKAA